MRRVTRLTIERLGHEGDGVAETPGGRVFVPLALPGETVEAQVDGERGRLILAGYDIEDFDSVTGLSRVLRIALVDTLALENTVPRNRTLIAAITTGAKLLELADHEERLKALEAALGGRA